MLDIVIYYVYLKGYEKGR